MSSLVIVESPAKAKTISKILGKEFGVKASVGHVKDLPEKELGVDVARDFLPTYIVIPGKEQVVRDLKREAKKAESVYIATDPDREGEAIAYHIAEEIRQPKSGKIFRVTFHEITEKSVREAMQNPGAINSDKVDAQQARRILDRLVGYNLSPFLWKKVRRGLSAGRVQSVAVRLVVDREREIEAFNKEEYWTIETTVGQLIADAQQFPARLYRYGNRLLIDRDAEEGKRFLITGADAAAAVVSDLQAKDFFIASVDKKTRRRSPYPPFITSTLQQEAARKLRFAAKRTMMLAQQLYEGIELGAEGAVGLITYMRTDAFRVAPEAQQWARELIREKFGKEYLPDKPPVYRSRSNAQEAHEAIRPTYPDKAPDRIKKYLSKDQYHLYQLIWNRFIASQMASAQLEHTTYIIGVKDSGTTVPGTELRATGMVVRFPGFMALYTESRDDIEEEEGGLLPPVREGEALRHGDLMPSQHFTQPPPRYTEATLVKALEEKGIGRPSTYAAIMSTIQDRKYVQKTENRFSPTELGIVVNDLLVDKFPELIDFNFTANMENELDEIETARMKWTRVVKDFYVPFNKDLTEASKDMTKVKPQDIPTDEKCEKCGEPMVIKWGRHGRFMACSGYPKCKNTRPLEGEGGQAPAEPELTGELCEKCGAPMVIKRGRYGKFMACSRYPECKNAKPIATGVKCPLDGGDLVERKSKRGKPFWSCSNYPNCTYAIWYKPLQQECPKCKAPFLVEKWLKGGQRFVACLNKECGYKAEAGPADTGGSQS
ncbi:MAG TPA: type I DNA topoisomerase [Dissulfurispiraceae bacterium]|nr:type I DNA topoisomerase [Dissulfurispiraceae bacterium]